MPFKTSASPDNERITLDENGQLTVVTDESSITQGVNGLQVSKPSQEVIGEFSTDFGEWNTSSSGDFGVTRTENTGTHINGWGVDIGDDSVYEDTGTASLSRDIDVTGYDTLVFGCQASESSYIRTQVVKINGTVVINDLVESGEYEVDLSGYSGTVTLEFFKEDTSTDDISTYTVGDIRMVKSQRTNYNGAGN